ncbi:hypothetical protein M422DRAFT_241296 [Sphaerobolus stellatus SS14]|nr:hypothetical protein M422DRAFT_241296 [Sphaerobolus stellatus SS14]
MQEMDIGNSQQLLCEESEYVALHRSSPRTLRLLPMKHEPKIQSCDSKTTIADGITLNGPSASVEDDDLGFRSVSSRSYLMRIFNSSSDALHGNNHRRIHRLPDKDNENIREVSVGNSVKELEEVASKDISTLFLGMPNKKTVELYPSITPMLADMLIGRAARFHVWVS